MQASTEELLDSGLLADCGLLDPVHAPMVVDHLVSVYYPTKDKTIDAECPINCQNTVENKRAKDDHGAFQRSCHLPQTRPFL